MAQRPPRAASSVFHAIWEVVARIPRGRVATYGQVARMAGLPGGARTAGWALAALPDDKRVGGRAVPWHRVVNARGAISARHGDACGDPMDRQAVRLRREGVVVSAGGGIDLSHYRWGGTRAARTVRHGRARTRRGGR